ncbi:MAG: heme exporter protein CcmD [Gammaproteobacteria bacterium]|nr:heme exporter protein CcmD [Gammaproteobacteria bacterium]
MSLSEFFHMGGYAFYVWASYGLALVVLIANVLVSVWQHKKLIAYFQGKGRRARRTL